MSRSTVPPGARWLNVENTAPLQYTCGYCSANVGSDRGYRIDSDVLHFIRICPLCGGPTFWDNGVQQPGVSFGAAVGELPADIATIYEEARVCCSSASYNAAVLLLRKLLMNVAVNLEAQEGQSFVQYVEYLADKGYVPPNGRGWVDHIRKRGNEANHQIVLMGEGDAKDLIAFAEMLLKFIYEFPKRVPVSAIETPHPAV